MAELSTKQEITLLRSAIAGLVGVDAEGAYRPEFVAQTLGSLKRVPTHTFTDTKKFLADIENA